MNEKRYKQRPLIYVVGDSILDVSVRLPSGKSFRRAPEADAPIVPTNTPATNEAPGGAANVAANLTALDNDVELFTSIGSDRAGAHLIKLLKSDRHMWIPRNPPTATTIKTRYYEANRLVVRVDADHDINEPVLPPDDPRESLEAPSAVVLTDYGRGALTRESVAAWCAAADAWGCPVFTDPKVGRSTIWHGRKGAANKTHVLNETEFADYVPGVTAEWTTAAIGIAAVEELFPLIDTELVVIKRGAHGSVVIRYGQIDQICREASVFEPQRSISVTSGYFAIQIPKVDPSVSWGLKDVQGAGDTYLAALVSASVRGLSPIDSALYASCAAGIAVSRQDTAIVSSSDVRESAKRYVERHKGVVSQKDAQELSAKLRALGFKVGYSNGCFDVRLHAGHIHTLKTGAADCDFLFVGVDADGRVRTLKGPGRPVVPQNDRAYSISNVAGVGAAFVFHDLTEAVRAIRPDVIFKGGDYRIEDMPETELVKEWGGKVIHTGTIECDSTTTLVARMTER